jgi:hypothetical protein
MHNNANSDLPADASAMSRRSLLRLGSVAVILGVLGLILIVAVGGAGVLAGSFLLLCTAIVNLFVGLRLRQHARHARGEMGSPLKRQK